jgi:hypothetical protein
MMEPAHSYETATTPATSALEFRVQLAGNRPLNLADQVTLTTEAVDVKNIGKAALIKHKPI